MHSDEKNSDTIEKDADSMFVHGNAHWKSIIFRATAQLDLKMQLEFLFQVDGEKCIILCLEID